MKKNRKLIGLSILALICFAICCIYYSKTFISPKRVDAMLTENIEELPPYVETVTVFVCGEVKNPDLYTLPIDSRIDDAIEAAGGVIEGADLERTDSLAQKLKDGQKIYVPNVNDDIDKINYMKDNSIRETGNTKLPTDGSSDVKVNINTAEIEELTLIPGIGEKTAQLIIEYREENGGFESVEEIMNVSRIGEKTFETIKEIITVE